MILEYHLLRFGGDQTEIAASVAPGALVINSNYFAKIQSFHVSHK